MENNKRSETTSNLLSGLQMSLWDGMRQTNGEPPMPNPFALTPEEELRRRKIAQHKTWLTSFPHECPSPHKHYRIGVYIRFFNQTKYSNYLDYHRQQFIDTIGLCPNWTIVDFYVDEGQSAPNMESAREWCRLLDDCFAGKIDLIITQKVSNVTRKPEDIAFVSRLLAALPRPVGVYFISEDIFTLASYYQEDLRDKGIIPHGWCALPDVPEEDTLACERYLDEGAADEAEGGVQK